MPKTFDIKILQNPDGLADAIATKFVDWEAAKDRWFKDKKETLENLYATSTRDIYNHPREYDNCTHIPKLTQIRDMLVTYYIDAMFSLPDAVEWEPYSTEDVSTNTKNALKALIKQMQKDSGFEDIIRPIVEDYVDYGDCFATAVNVTDKIGKTIVYQGPKAVRINPAEIYFDPLAADFKKAPKIIKTIMTIGELAKNAEELPEDAAMYKKAIKDAIKQRGAVRNSLSVGDADELKNDMVNIAGFGSWRDYYASDCVELLTFYGDIYDMQKDELHTSKKIVIMDRSIVLLEEDIKDYGFECNIFHSGWRNRKDVLWSMSPLDNIKGMQFMIDFLENKRADIFNFISNPVIVTRGDVEMPEYLSPGQQIGLDVDGDFQFAKPDATALQADTYISIYLALMEEMAGTPKEAMGFRTPGEKTAFEVSQLNTASSRLFNEKVRKFEKEILEPLLTLMIRMYLAVPGRIVKVHMKDANNRDITRDINLDELMSSGRFVATGSSTYTEKARIAQTLLQLSNSALYNDQLVSNYFDPKILAEAITYATGLDKFNDLLRPNARIDAEIEMRQAAEVGTQMLEEQQVRGIADAEQAPM